MSTEFPTLASLLGDHGYCTGAIVNAPSLSPEFGVNRGFGHYDFLRPWSERSADQVTELALAWIDMHKDRPFFLFVHYFDPHLPYAPPVPYDSLFDPAYAGPLGHSFNIGMATPRRDDRVVGYGSLPEADRRHIAALYDGEIAFADKAIGALVDGIDRRGLRNRTLLIFLSDHGEELFDHGGLDHGHSLFDELIRVPLIISLPGTIPGKSRVSEHVRLLDVMPTVLDMLGLRQPAHLEGVSLKNFLTGGVRPRPDGAVLLRPGDCYAEALRHRMTVKSLTAYPWKLIYDIRTHERLLFNLETDPREQQDLAARGVSPPAGSARMFADLDRMLTRTLLRLSDTWYVEMVPGDGYHTFGFDINVHEPRPPGQFSLARLIGGDQETRDLAHVESAVLTPSRIGASDLRVTESVTLAFKTDIEKTPLSFYLTIDGQPAARRTFIGSDLLRPVTMPFVEQVSDDNGGLGSEPARRPEPPYFLIWRYTSPYQGATSIELDEDMKRELRALGYIQ
jgi:arylsulfatase A-like enzyme